MAPRKGLPGSSICISQARTRMANPPRTVAVPSVEALSTATIPMQPPTVLLIRWAELETGMSMAEGSIMSLEERNSGPNRCS